MTDKTKQSKNLQLLTKTNKKKYKVDDLDRAHQEAVFLRIEGADYRYIAMRLKYSYTYVREMFAEGGICKPAYDELVSEISEEAKLRFAKLQQTMEESAPEAFNNLRRFARKNWKAAESLLHIVGFTPLQKIKAEIETKDLNKVADMVEEIGTYVKSEIVDSHEKTS